MMDWLRQLRFRLLALFRRRNLEAEMAEEMRAHLEFEAAARRAEGLSEEDARQVAQRAFGGAEQAKERCRDEFRLLWLEQLGQDLRYAIRSLAKSPSFTLTVVLTLALGIGVNVALFFVFNLVALRPLPVKDPDGLVRVAGQDARGRNRPGFSHAEYVVYRDANRTLEGLVAFHERKAPFRRSEDGERATGAEDNGIGAFDIELVSENYFSVLGGTTPLGRAFLPEELVPGSDAARVIVLSHWFWTTHLHRDPQALGTTLRIENQPFTVIGVAAADFCGQYAIPPAGWLPAGALSNAKVHFGPTGSQVFKLIGRLQPGITEAQAKADLDAIAARRATEFPGETAKVAVALERGMRFLKFNRQARITVSTLSLGFAMVLVIACTNVANLLLARGLSRQSEIGVRLTLGAGRGRIVRQLLTENALLCALGAVVGLGLALWTLQLLQPVILSWIPVRLPMDPDTLPFFDLTPDHRVLAFTALLTLAAILVAGLMPALQATSADVIAAIRNDGSTFGRRLSPSRLRRWLVVSQVTVSLTLLSCAGVLVRNFLVVRSADVGFDPSAVYQAFVTPNPAIKDRAAAFRQALDTLRAIPGVAGAAVANRGPMSPPVKRPRIRTVAASGGGAAEEMAVSFITGDFFATFGIPLLRGRTFGELEHHSAARAIVVSESLARQLWPGQEATGKTLAVAEAAWATRERPAPAEAFRECEVIGVARDVVGELDQDDRRLIYLPFALDAWPSGPVFLRPRSESAAALREIVRAAEAGNVGLQWGRTLSAWRELVTLPHTILAFFSAILGVLALVLASVGLYGVIAFIVSQRVREIGIRMALGATARKVVALFVRQGMRLVTVGLVLGLIGGRLFALALSRMSDAGLNTFNATAFAATALLFAGIAWFACWLPARRAAKVDPMVALRAE